MSSKINEVPPRHRSKFTDILAAYDLEVDKSCIAIKDSIDKIIEKQYDIADKFIELIDEVLRAKSDNLENETDEPQHSRNSLIQQVSHTIIPFHTFRTFNSLHVHMVFSYVQLTTFRYF
jgi:hypothetical protein